MNNRLLNTVKIIVAIVWLSSCTSTIVIEEFSSEEWKSDRNGCRETRLKYADTILDSKDHLLGQSEKAILKLMGRPDKNELYRRQQKLYIYYLEPGPPCDEPNVIFKQASYLSIRFNATGVSNEVFIYE